MATILTLAPSGSGVRHFIGDVPIHCGDPIRACVNGKWFDGRYEASWRRGIPHATFHYDDGSDDGAVIWLSNEAGVSDVPVELGSGSRYTP